MKFPYVSRELTTLSQENRKLAEKGMGKEGEVGKWRVRSRIPIKGRRSRKKIIQHCTSL